MEPTPQKQLDAFLGKFTPAIAAQARTVMAKIRERLPGAVELVYDKVNAVVVGFGPTERPSDAVFSIVVFPRWILLYFLQGAVLPRSARAAAGQREGRAAYPAGGPPDARRCRRA